MKIDALNTAVINKENQAQAAEARAGRQSRTINPEAQAEPAAGDKVQLSERARLVARANELASAAPEVRQEKVDELRSRLAAGTYDVSGRTVAESMLKKSITEV